MKWLLISVTMLWFDQSTFTQTISVSPLTYDDAETCQKAADAARNAVQGTNQMISNFCVPFGGELVRDGELSQ